MLWAWAWTGLLVARAAAEAPAPSVERHPPDAATTQFEVAAYLGLGGGEAGLFAATGLGFDAWLTSAIGVGGRFGAFSASRMDLERDGVSGSNLEATLTVRVRDGPATH